MQLILFIIIIPILISAAIAGLSAAPWLPTKPKQRRHVIDAVKPAKDAVCYDLGCGDGSVLFALAKAYPGIRAIGYDISLLPLAVGIVRKYLGGKTYKNISLRFGNLFTQSVSDADIVFVFLLDKSYPRLTKKFAAELKDDAVVIVEAWPFKEITPARTLREEGLLPVYFYNGSDFR